MNALTKKEVVDIIKDRPDNAFYCPDCFYVLEKIECDDCEKLTCQSQVCENSDAYYDLKGEYIEE